MKKLLVYTVALLGGFLTSCQKDTTMGPAATNLDASTITHEAGEGTVTLKWETPKDANYKYIEVKYHHPKTNKQHLRLASKFSTSIQIDELLAAFGEIEYSLTPVTAGGKRGQTVLYKAQCNPLPKRREVVENTAVELPLTAEKMWTDTHHPSGNDAGGMAALIDGRNDTYWHMRWDTPAREFPHYLVVELSEPITQAMSFYWKGRNNQNKQNPKKIAVFATNKPFVGTTNNPGDFDESKYNLVRLFSTKNSAGQLVDFSFTGMSDEVAAEYTSPAKLFDGSYKYLWFKFEEGHNSPKWSAIAEWKIFKHKVREFDPETGETKEL